MQLSLVLFGPFQATWAGKLVTFPTGAARALLAYLALEADRPHPRELLAALLWPDQPQAAAYANLRQTLARVRKALPNSADLAVLAITPQTIQFQRSAATLDVDGFEDQLADSAVHAHADLAGCSTCMQRLQQAAALYRGELLQGLFLPHSQPFNEWLLVKREELHRQALELLDTMARAHETAADFAPMRRYAARQLALEPWREVAHCQLMRALAYTGQREAALAQYETCCRILDTELGMEPAPETTALYALIKAGKPVDRKPAEPPSLRRAWIDAPDTGPLFGRPAEVALLQQWLVHDECRVVALLGMGGVGKTTLAATVVRAVAAHFDSVIWHSLINAPPLDELLRVTLQALSGHSLAVLPASLDEQLALLLDNLRRRRCLLVLDNLESVLHAGQAGTYRAGYEPYGQLIHHLVEHEHKSILLLTSRERAQGLSRLEGDTHHLRSLRLAGLDLAAGQAMLAARGVAGQQAHAIALVERYSGNPLALKLVSQTVQDLFLGDISAFLAAEAPIFDDIRTVLDQQYARLSELECEILIWLAIEREPITIPALRENLVYHGAARDFVEALRALQRRSLLERMGDGFSLQNVVIEYLTERLITGVCAELLHADQASSRPDDREQRTFRDSLAVLNRFALVKAQAKEYVRQSQKRMILQPVVERLVGELGPAELAARAQAILAGLRVAAPLAPGYAGGNLLNLLLHAGIDISGYNFSRLCVWQADLQGRAGVELNFGASDLTGSIFTLILYPDAVIVGPEGEMVVAGSNANDLCLWHAAHGQLQLAVRTPGQITELLTVSPDGQLVATSCWDDTMRVWSVATGTLLHTLEWHGSMTLSAAFSHDGQFLAAGSSGDTVYLWELDSGRTLQTLRHPLLRQSRLAFRPARDGERRRDVPMLASGGDEQVICVWDLEHGQVVDELRGHAQTIECLTFSPDGSLLASGSHDGLILLWNMDSSGHGELRGTLRGHSHIVRAVAFHPNGQLLASGSADGTVRLWSVSTGEMRQLLAGHGHEIIGLAFDPDSRVLATVSADRGIRLWEVETGRPLNSLTGYMNAVLVMHYRPDGRQLASASGDGRIHLWDTRHSRMAGMLPGYAGRLNAFAYSPDGRLLATASSAATVQLWDLAGSTATRTLRGQQGYLKSLAFSPDGRWLAGGGVDRTIFLWTIPDGAAADALDAARVLHGHADDIETVAYSSDGRLLVSSSLDHTARLWSLDSGEVVHVLTGHTAALAAAAFSPRGDRIATMSYDDTLRLWDVATGRLVPGWDSLRAGGKAVAFSPTGDLVAHTHNYVELVLRNVESGAVVRTLRGHRGFIFGLEWSPREPVLASSSLDGTVRLWNVDTGVCEQILQPPGPYAGMNIAGATGISDAQRAALLALGAAQDTPRECIPNA